MSGTFRRLAVCAMMAAPLPMTFAAHSEVNTRPVPEKLRNIPGHERQLFLRRIVTVNGKREGMHFARNQRIEIRGIQLSDGNLGNLQAWILGANRGGSMLEIINATNQLIVAKPIDVAANRSAWPMHSGGAALPTQTIKVLIRDDNQPGRDLTISLPNSYYACIHGEQVCGGRR